MCSVREARAVPAGARYRDACARARRPEVGAPGSGPACSDASLGASRSYVGPKARKTAEELRAADGLERALLQARVTARRLLVPDASVTWNLTAIPAAIRIVRRGHRCRHDDVASRLDPLRRRRRQAGDGCALACRPSRPARRQPAAACGPPQPGSTSGERAARPARRPPRGCDLMRFGRDRGGGARARPARNRPHDRERLRLRRLRGPRVPAGAAVPDHAHGSFFGKRDPRPFLQALHDSGVDALARFVGDFRGSDREWAESLGLGDRLELIPYVPRLESLRLQRDSEALLLLIPNADGEEGSAVGKGLRVPGCRQADSRRRPAGRRCGGAHPRDRRRSRGRARRRGGYSRRTACALASVTAAACPRSSLDDDRGVLSRAAPRDRGLLRELVASKGAGIVR